MRITVPPSASTSARCWRPSEAVSFIANPDGQTRLGLAAESYHRRTLVFQGKYLKRRGSNLGLLTTALPAAPQMNGIS
ncbi:hypothetical protein GN956_G18355 [Arapaima gigas]